MCNFYQAIILFVLLTVSKILSIPVSDVGGSEGMVVRTVPWGSTVILRCRSNDDDHNFLYWHLVNKGTIIGVANPYDIAKFKFEILSGNLTIRAVSKHEEGLYECVSRAVKGEDINIRVVRIVVQNDWEDLYEHDYNINLIRILIAAITLVLISMGAWFVYRTYKDRYRYPSYLQPEEDEDDESTEELFSQPSTSSKPSVNNIVPPKSKPTSKKPSLDSIDISTDFKSILDTANDK